MVRQSATAAVTAGLDSSAEANFIAPPSPSRPYGGFE